MIPPSSFGRSIRFGESLDFFRLRYVAGGDAFSSSLSSHPKLAHFGGNQTMQMYGKFEGFPLSSALFGLVI